MLKLLFSILCAGLIATPALAADAPYVISGFDDVLRQAENTGLLKSAIKIFEKDQGFTGMAVLYSEISKNESDPRFSLVSGIGTWFEGRVDALLKKDGYPSRRLYLRNWITQMNLEKFKLDRVSEIIETHSARKFIIVFDNSDVSIRLADQLMDKFPDKIQAVYLHQIVDKKTPARAHSYHTAFDIALGEYQNGRLDEDSVKIVANEVLQEKRLDALIPSYAACPRAPSSNDSALPQEIATLRAQVDSHLHSLCSSRDK